jgi:hypothetical protein
MDYYIALNGEALSTKNVAVSHTGFGQSAKELLDACGGNLDEAKALLRQSAVIRSSPS